MARDSAPDDLPEDLVEVNLHGLRPTQALRRLAQEHGIKIDEVRTAYPATAQTVAGVRVFEAASYSWGH